MAKIKLLNLLYEGPDAPITQRFGNKDVNVGGRVIKDYYAKWGLHGHDGLDFGIANNTKLYSCINGEVTEARFDPGGYGNYIKVENNDCGALYAHLGAFKVVVGESVKAGELVGLSDNTGNSTGPHLHFGVFPKPRDRENGYNGYIDPLNHNLVEWVEDSTIPTQEEENESLKRTIANLQKLLEDTEEQVRQLQRQDLTEKGKLREVAKDLGEVIES